MSKHLFISTVLLLCYIGQRPLSAQTDIRSIQIYPTSKNVFDFPILSLRSASSITLSFDDLDNYAKQFYYKIILCSYNWQESDVHYTHYINGFPENTINNFELSQNTLVPYYHYTVSFPNESINILLAGNYKVQVYEENGNILFERRFCIVDEQVSVYPNVAPTLKTKDGEPLQHVPFEIDNSNTNTLNRFERFHTATLQNNDWNTLQIHGSYKFINGSRLSYELDESNYFKGGNQYLFVNTKYYREGNLRISSFKFLGNIYLVDLFPEKPRMHQPYTHSPDMDGAFVPDKNNALNKDLESDYLFVRFYLVTPQIFDEEVYLYGSWNNYELSKDNRLTYDKNLSRYSGTILLKQGYYEYQYISYNPITRERKTTHFSGSHHVTQNTYRTLVYYTDTYIGYDKLVGYATVNSLPNR